VVGLARGAYRRRGPGTFRAWLRAVVGHEAVDLARQRRPAAGGGADGGACGEQADPVGLDELAGEVDEQFRADCARAEEVCARVRGRVLPHTWEAFARTYLQGHEAREVAGELGLTLSGVYKARDRVRQMLEAEGQAEPPSPESPVPTDDSAPLRRPGQPAVERRPAG
jgi:DNA-directed RNA polymerase specialized sigma24 family protein